MFRRASLLACSILGAGAAICPPLAQAQQSDQTAAASSGGLEEIVVTARRREEKLQTVPIAITAFSQESLDEKSITAVQNLQNVTPSLLIGGQTRDEAQFTLRGLGAGPISSGTRIIQSVATYFDQVPSDISGPGVFYDLENVQILKGAQGTLFGRNTVGGAILFEPKKPTNAFEGYIQAQFGNYGDKEFEGALNVPIVSDKLLLRVAGDLARRDGYTVNVFNGQDLDDRNFESWRVSLTWRPTDDFQNELVYNGLYKQENGTSAVLYALNTGLAFTHFTVPGFGTFAVTLGDGPAVAGLTGSNPLGTLLAGEAAGNKFSLFPNAAAVLTLQNSLGPRQVYSTQPLEDLEYHWGLTDIATYDVSDNITLKNIFGYRSDKALESRDYADTSLPLLRVTNTDADGWTQNNETFTDEFQIQGKSFGDKLTWITGAYYEYFHPGGFSQILNDQFGTLGNRITYEQDSSRALFAQATYDFGGLVDALEGLRLTGGYRYTWDHRSVASATFTLPHTCTQGNPINCTVAGSADFHAPSWTVGLDYQVTPDTLVYVTSRRGYESGGFNLPAPTVATEEYKPEYVTDVEVGIKSDWEVAGVKVRTNADYFHDWFTNIQVAAAAVTPTGIVDAVQNAATASIDGFELEGTVLPFKGLELSPFYSFTQATYDEFPGALEGNLTGRQFNQVPKNKWGITARYTFPADEAMGNITLSTTYTYQAHSTGIDPGDPVFAVIPGYGLLDFSLDWRNVYQQPIDVSFFMSNALDKVYYQGGLPLYSGAGFASALYGEPRMFGFRVKYRFGAEPAPEAAPAAYVQPPVVAPAPAPKSYLVFFDFNKSDLTPQAVGIVDMAARNAGSAKVTQLTVTGHTDTVGSDAYNMRLSRRRAESVAAELEKDGIASSEIEIVAKGKRDLLVPTKDGVKEPQNRRVQIVYSGNQAS
jgi:iron complex outermembrane receptor protein